MALASTQLSIALQRLRASANGIELAIETMNTDEEQTKTRQFLFALTDDELVKVVTHSAKYDGVNGLAVAEQSRRILDAPTWDSDSKQQQLAAALSYLINAHSSVELTPLQIQRVMAAIGDDMLNAICKTGMRHEQFRAKRLKQLIQVVPTNMLSGMEEFVSSMAVRSDDDYEYVLSTIKLCKEEIARRSALSHVYVDKRSGMQRVHYAHSPHDLEREMAALSTMTSDELKIKIAEIKQSKSNMWREMTLLSAAEAEIERKLYFPNTPSNCCIA